MPAEIVSLARAGGSFAVKWLPGFIARWWFNEQRLDSRVNIALRDITPISVGGSPAQLDLWFRISNHSSADVRVDRIVVHAWFGQPTAMMFRLVPLDVPAHSEVKSVHLTTVLSEDVAQNARIATQSPEFGGQIHLYVTMVCKTPFREFLREVRVERDGAAARFALPIIAPPPPISPVAQTPENLS